VLIVLATVFLIGMGERAWSIGRADSTSFSLVALILLGPTAAPARPPVSRHPAISTNRSV
jgi:hypothetical protein